MTPSLPVTFADVQAAEFAESDAYETWHAYVRTHPTCAIDNDPEYLRLRDAYLAAGRHECDVRDAFFGGWSRENAQ